MMLSKTLKAALAGLALTLALPMTQASAKDLIAQLEEADDSAGADFASDDAEDGSEEGPLFEAPCGPTMLH